MLLQETIILKWASVIKKHYVNLGYNFTKIGDEFVAKVADLPLSSHMKVWVQCDNCGNVIQKEYREYIKSQQYNDGYGDLCSKCAIKRIDNVLINKYGGIGLQSPEIKAKAQDTNVEKYGFHAPMMNKDVYQKVRQTQNEKYGGIGMASECTRNKIENTNLKIRGVRNPSQDDKIKEKKIITYLQHYGVDHPFKIKEISSAAVIKAKETLLKNGKNFVSKSEQELVKILIQIYGKEFCIPQFYIPPFTLDCLLIINHIKIDVEYDGWYWHQNRQEKDADRDNKLFSLGYKVLRIRANKLLPTIEQIQNAINYLLNTNFLFTSIELDIDM